MKLVCFGLKCVMKDTYHHIHVMKGCLSLFIDLLVLFPGLASIAGAEDQNSTYPTPKGRFLGKSCPKMIEEVQTSKIA